MTGFPVEMGCPKFLKLESWELLPCGYGREGGCLERHRIRKAWICVPAFPFTSYVILSKLLPSLDLKFLICEVDKMIVTAQDCLEDGMRKGTRSNKLSTQSEGRGDRT